MAGPVLARVIDGLVVLAVISVLGFLGINLIGDPLDVLVPPECTAACRDAAAERLGLNLPLWEQYFIFMANLLKGDLGNSFVYGAPALRVIVERLPATLELAAVAMAISLIVGLPLGFWAGLHPRSPSGRSIMGLSILGFSMPSFWVGILAIILFGAYLQILPVTGRGATASILGINWSIATLDGWHHIILPAVNLAIFQIALIIRLVSNGTSEINLTEYIKFAHARGIRNSRISYIHIGKNIMLPIITIIGIELGSIIAFSVVTETIFSWPGIGKLLIDSIRVLDRPVVIGCMLIISAIFIIINIMVDILYSFIDPRVRFRAS